MELAFGVSLLLASAILFAFVLILGMMREVVILRSELEVFRRLVTNPPALSFAGKQVPAALRTALAAVGLGASDRQVERTAVAFLSASCGGCDALVADLRAAVVSARVAPESLAFVVSAPSEDGPLFRAARGLSSRVLLDRDGRLFQACEVEATPTVLILEGPGSRVSDHVFGGNAEWIRERLQPSRREVEINPAMSS